MLHPASPQNTRPVVTPTAHPSDLGSWPSIRGADTALSASAASTAAQTARETSSSCCWPGKPKAMRNLVPLSSVMSRRIVPPRPVKASWTALTAAWVEPSWAGSHGRWPKPSSLRKTVVMTRCSDTQRPACPAASLSSMRGGTKQRSARSASGSSCGRSDTPSIDWRTLDLRSERSLRLAATDDCFIITTGTCKSNVRTLFCADGKIAPVDSADLRRRGGLARRI
eukprot:scaffold61831_cov28-Tisochrysis_lutea.AAC.2